MRFYPLAFCPFWIKPFLCYPSKYQAKWPSRTWKITDFVRAYKKRHFLWTFENPWKSDKKCFSRKNAKQNAQIKTAIRFYNILSCLPPNIAPILAFVIELLSIVQAQLGWQKRVWNCEHFFHVYNKKKTFYWTDVKQLKKEDVLKSFTFDWKYHEKRKQKWTKKKL